ACANPQLAAHRRFVPAERQSPPSLLQEAESVTPDLSHPLALEVIAEGVGMAGRSMDSHREI
ncbi:MAG: hypothetical protein ACKOJF_10260, partial [Planctomycetaceae bacterium]